MEEENNNTEKRKRKAPERFEALKTGDHHPPLAERARKSIENKGQKIQGDEENKISRKYFTGFGAFQEVL